jgi:hypothetical protein
MTARAVRFDGLGPMMAVATVETCASELPAVRAVVAERFVGNVGPLYF